MRDFVTSENIKQVLRVRMYLQRVFSHSGFEILIPACHFLLQIEFSYVVDVFASPDWHTIFFHKNSAWLYSKRHQSSIYGEFPMNMYFPNSKTNLDNLLYIHEKHNNVIETLAFGFEGLSIHSSILSSEYASTPCLPLLLTRLRQQDL